MKFESISIQGFRSYRRDQTLSFMGNRPGLYLMMGENRANPDLGGNGVGKSSIWDALTWLFTGKTLRNLKARTIQNWENIDKTNVSAIFWKQDTKYTVTRTQAPNTLTLRENKSDPHPITDARLQEITGLNHSFLSNTLVMGQFNKYFFDLTPTEMLQQFADALDLKIWNDAGDTAKLYVADQEERIQLYQVHIANLTGRIEANRETIKRLAQLEKTQNKEWQTTKRGLESALEKMEKRLNTLDKEITPLKAKIARQNTEKEQLTKELIEWDTKIRLKREQRAALESTINHLEDQIGEAQSEKQAINSLGNVCGACGQSVSAGHKRRKIAEADKKIARLECNLALHTGRLAKRIGNINKIADIMKDIDKELDGVEREKRRLEQDLSTKLANVGMVKREIANVNAELERGNAPVADVRKQLEEERYKQQRSYVAREQYEAKLKKANQRVADYGYWVKGFKDLRLHIVRDALDELEIAVNNTTLQLGLRGWEVTFDIERENQKGGISRGFNVMIKSPQSRGKIPWEAWCGGETQRLRIAGAIGLADMLRARRGLDLGIEVWDEPTQHLSPEGIEDLLEFFEARARENGRQVWLADHHSLSFGGFNQVIKVVLDAQGSHILQTTRGRFFK